MYSKVLRPEAGAPGRLEEQCGGFHGWTAEQRGVGGRVVGTVRTWAFVPRVGQYGGPSQLRISEESIQYLFQA